VFPVSWLRPEALPAGMEVLCVFPEGTEGNGKSLVQVLRRAPDQRPYLAARPTFDEGPKPLQRALRRRGGAQIRLRCSDRPA
jgi:hypothetical protein